MKKGDRSEKLSEWLSQADDDLLDEAYSIDSAAQLKERAKGEKNVRKTVYIRNYAVRRLIVAALCLFVLAGVLLTVPALFKTDEPLVDPSATGGSAGHDLSKPEQSLQGAHSETPSQPDGTGNAESSKAEESTQGTQPENPSQPDGTGAGEQSKPDKDSQGTQSEDPSQSGGSDLPNVELPTEGLRIEGIDMLNYYSAIRVLASSPGNAFSHLSAGGGSVRGVRLLAAEENTPPETTASPPSEEEQSAQPPEVSEPAEQPDIYYYELDPNAVFYITKVSFFQIELTDETGFLASKLGTGVVDVVITEGYTDYYDDPMITFKNGDRYFSCLLNGGSRSDYMEFSTHKYIEGFRIVKNFVQENYAFNVCIVDDQVEHFECSNWYRGENPDGVLPVVSKTYVSNEFIGYTIAELEDYFNAGVLPA